MYIIFLNCHPIWIHLLWSDRCACVRIVHGSCDDDFEFFSATFLLSRIQKHRQGEMAVKIFELTEYPGMDFRKRKRFGNARFELTTRALRSTYTLCSILRMNFGAQCAWLFSELWWMSRFCRNEEMSAEGKSRSKSYGGRFQLKPKTFFSAQIYYFSAKIYILTNYVGCTLIFQRIEPTFLAGNLRNIHNISTKMSSNWRNVLLKAYT